MSQTSIDALKENVDALAQTVGGDVKNIDTRLSSLEENGVPPQISQRVEALEASQTAQDTEIQDAADAAATAQSTAEAAKSAVNPVGTVIAFAANSAPSGYLLCNGAAVSRTTYAALFATIGTLYGAGNGSTTFNLPNLTNRFIQGSGTAGTEKAAGLPNITGDTPLFTIPGAMTYAGAFSASGNNGRGYLSSTNTGGTTNGVKLDASASNPIYGASETVQPPALTMRYYIKY